MQLRAGNFEGTGAAADFAAGCKADFRTAQISLGVIAGFADGDGGIDEDGVGSSDRVDMNGTTFNGSQQD